MANFDEKQHNRHARKCEIIRMKEVVGVVGLPTFFVRHNPDYGGVFADEAEAHRALRQAVDTAVAQGTAREAPTVQYLAYHGLAWQQLELPALVASVEPKKQSRPDEEAVPASCKRRQLQAAAAAADPSSTTKHGGGEEPALRPCQLSRTFQSPGMCIALARA